MVRYVKSMNYSVAIVCKHLIECAAVLVTDMLDPECSLGNGNEDCLPEASTLVKLTYGDNVDRLADGVFRWRE